jgi:hypothetical protein
MHERPERRMNKAIVAASLVVTPVRAGLRARTIPGARRIYSLEPRAGTRLELANSSSL